MITIKYDKSCDMIEIHNKSLYHTEIFCGNSWDFKRDPKSLKEFLELCDLDVEIVEYKYDEQ